MLNTGTFNMFKRRRAFKKINFQKNNPRGCEFFVFDRVPEIPSYKKT